MRTINFGGYIYYYAYRMYVTEPCLIRKTNGIYPGCTRTSSIAYMPLENGETYYSPEEAKEALKNFRSIIREGGTNAPRGFAYVIEFYAQLLIIDEEGTPYNEEEERIYAEMEKSKIRQKKPPVKNNPTDNKSSHT